MSKRVVEDNTAMAPTLFIPTIDRMLDPGASGARGVRAFRFLSIVHDVLRALQRYSLNNGHATILAYTRCLGRGKDLYSTADVGYGVATQNLPLGGDSTLPNGDINWVVARIVFCSPKGKETAQFVQFRSADFVRDARGHVRARRRIEEVLGHIQHNSTDPNAAAISVNYLDLDSLLATKKE